MCAMISFSITCIPYRHNSQLNKKSSKHQRFICLTHKSVFRYECVFFAYTKGNEAVLGKEYLIIERKRNFCISMGKLWAPMSDKILIHYLFINIGPDV
jgi:hypothetical protein